MGFTESINSFNQSINEFFSFLGEQLKSFKQLETPEQIAFISMGFGILLIIVSVILFLF